MPGNHHSTTNRRTFMIRTMAAMLVAAGFSNNCQAESANDDKSGPYKNFKYRIIEPWHEPDGISFFSHCPNIFTLKDMRKTDPSSPLGRYVTQVRDWGFNYMSMYGTHEQEPEAWSRFASHLKANGIGMIVRRDWYETERGYSWPFELSEAAPRKSQKLCPHSKATREFWEKRIEEDYKMLPDILLSACSV